MFASGSRTCCVVTGASRGFGRSVAIALAREFSNSGVESHFVLVSRSQEGLRETGNKITEACSGAKGKVLVIIKYCSNQVLQQLILGFLKCLWSVLNTAK